MRRLKYKRKPNEFKLEDYVIFSIVMMLLYTIIELILSSITTISHDTLTTCFFAFFGGEITICGLIKIFKLIIKIFMI